MMSNFPWVKSKPQLLLTSSFLSFSSLFLFFFFFFFFLCQSYSKKIFFDFNFRSPEKDKRNRSKGKYRQRKNLFDQYETVALYIGVEYECQLGHRFLFSGKNPKHSKTYKQQESEQSFILSNDLPLITQCPSCNLNVPQNSGYMMKFAQLMRIFIVTPDSPSLITFAPKVQLLSTKKETSNEASSSQIEIIFDSGFEKGIVLPKNTTIVARLPYIYYSKGKYYHPQTSQLVLSKHFLYYNPVTEQQQSLPQQKIE